MGAGIPLVHASQHRLALVHRQHGAFGDDIEVGVGDDGGDFDNAISVRVQAGHFQVDPDQAIGITHYSLLASGFSDQVFQNRFLKQVFGTATEKGLA